MTPQLSVASSCLFWGCIAGIFYAYLGYPIVIRLAAGIGRRFNPGHPLVRKPTADALPRVTVLVVAYNAAEHLHERLQNVLASDYPYERLKVVVASDGSNDDTVAIARRFADQRVHVIAYEQRRGKAATLIDAMTSIDSSVVVLTDASTRFDRHSLKALVTHFVDPDMGLVSGRCKMFDESGELAESIYWRSEMRLRQCESSLGLTLGASGAIYAVRREFFVATDRPMINDDMVLPLLMRMSHTCRMVLDPEAIAHAKISSGFAIEFRRRVRIGIGAHAVLECSSWHLELAEPLAVVRSSVT